MSDVIVSVYVVTCNRAAKLKRCLDSILGQDFKGFEVIVVDNGSKDGTANFLESYSQRYRNLKYISLGENKGACYARNVAIKNSAGIYITGSDDDDSWMPNRISELYKKYSPEFSFTYADDFFVGSGKPKLNKKPNCADLAMMKFQNVVGNQVFTEKYKFVDVGFFDESLVAAQDYDIWYRMIKKYGPAFNVGKPLQNIYVDGADRITASLKKKFGYFSFYKKHKKDFSLAQKKYQLLNIKHVCQVSISARAYFTLFECDHFVRRLGVLVRKVIFKSQFKF